MQVETEQVLTVANSNNFVVPLSLEGAAWAEISKIREAVAVSGIGGVKIKEERYQSGTETVWVCTSGCGGFIEWGYWTTEPVYAYRPSILRKSGTVLEVPLTFDGTDFDPDATLTFTVKSSAIVDYDGASLTAIMPVITAVSAPLPLTEQNLGESVVRFTITGGRYTAQFLEGAVTVAGIAGVGVSDVVRKSDTVLEVPLTFDGTDFDTDATLAFTVSPDATENLSVPVTAMIPVTAVIEGVSASATPALTETTLDEGVVTLLLTAAAFEQDLSKIRDAVLVSGIDGVTIDTATVQRLSDRRIQVELDYDGTDFIRDTALTLTLTSKAIANHNGEVTTEIPVTANRNEDILTIFWIDGGTDKIQRGNLDMANSEVSNIEDIVTGLENPSGIALDVVSGKMYWTDWDRDKIQRANLDGSNIEDLVTQGLRSPRGIALDVEGGKMYWTDWDTDKIQRANLDGSNVEDLVTGLEGPRGIAIAMSSLVNRTEEPTIVKEDVNRDGVVDVQDLAYVGLQYGKTGTNAADVNGDKVVDVDDFILVAAAIDTAAAAAPAARAQVHSHFTKAQLQGWLTEARASGNTSRTYQRGIAVVEQLLALIAPEKTALLANYPNPFNPETWIPYQLSKSAEVTLTIYAVDGQVVRTLALGHQTAGMYQSRSRAAYWDGRNAVGEPVASGLYCYTLTTGDFTATRKMLIRK